MLPTVLLIAPDAVTRALIKYHLCRAGYTVYEAPSYDTWAMEASLHPNMIIVDELVDFMPFDQQVPQLVLTDLPHPSSTQQQRTFLTKPVRATNLLSAVFTLSH